MQLNKLMSEEYKQEAVLTKKMLERVPFNNPTWKPHEKSMTIQRLASHIAEIPIWMLRTLSADHFDFASVAQQEKYHAKDQAELLQKFEESYSRALEAFTRATEDVLMDSWTVRRGDQVIFSIPRIVAIRKWVFSHTIHHRAQLSVYLRLNGIPVPGMYGPSADER